MALVEQMSHYHIVTFFEEKDEVAFYQNRPIPKTRQNIETRRSTLHSPITKPFERLLPFIKKRPYGIRPKAR